MEFHQTSQTHSYLLSKPNSWGPMLLELFSYVNFINAMAFVYDGTVNCFSLTFCIILIQVLLLLTVTLRGVSNKHCLLPLFSFWTCFVPNRFLSCTPKTL